MFYVSCYCKKQGVRLGVLASRRELPGECVGPCGGTGTVTVAIAVALSPVTVAVGVTVSR